MINIRRSLCLGLLISLFMGSMAQAQGGQEVKFDFDLDIGPKMCSFPDLELPPNTKIYGTGDYTGARVHWQIDNSGKEASLIKVAVNSPEDPVVLFLGAYTPNVWHIGWTKKTKIVAVMVSGYHSQRIAGLPSDVPVINSTFQNQGACGHFYISDLDKKATKASRLSKSLFGREIDEIFPVVNGQAVVGETLPAGVELITSTKLRQEDFHIPGNPLGDTAGLQEAIRKRQIRKASSGDIQKYLAAVAQGEGLPDQVIAKGLSADADFTSRAYVVLSPDFIIPAGLSDSSTFILPEDLAREDGPLGRGNVKSVAEAKLQAKPRKPIAGTCAFSDLKIPPNLKVYAAGAYSGTWLKNIDDGKGNLTGSMKVIINSPQEPVALLLGAYDPTIWSLELTEGTKISAIVVSGYNAQSLNGVPSGVPVIDGRHGNSKQCPGFYVSSSLSNLLTINQLSNHLFKQDIDQVFYVKSGQAVVGESVSGDTEPAPSK